MDNKTILARNPNKKAKRELDNLGRLGDFNGYRGGYGAHKTSKRDGERRRRKAEDRRLLREYA